jgi:hypothetical protein
MAHVTMRDLCDAYSVSRDQVIRLRDYWSLPKRHDRRLRRRPPQEMPEPSEQEVAASEETLELAPYVAACVTAIQARWTLQTREERRVAKPVPLTVSRVELPPDAKDAMESFSE